MRGVRGYYIFAFTMARKIILSDETPNSKGFIVRTEGVHLARFRKNPVMLDSHKNEIILGKLVNLEVSGTQILAEPFFNEKNDHAKVRKQEFEDGFLNGASAGLRPIGLTFKPEDFDFSGPVPVLLKCQLVEGSLCAIPSNENSLSLFDNNGNIIENVEALLQEIKLSAQSSSHLNLNDMEFKKELATTLGLNENASDAEILAAQKAQKTKLDGIELSVKTLAKSRAIELIDAGIAAKKIKPEQKDTYLAKAESDYDFVKLSLDNMGAPATPEKKLADFIKEGKNDEGKNLSDADQSTKWNYLAWVKNAPKELKLMETENPDQYNALLKKYQDEVHEKNKG